MESRLKVNYITVVSGLPRSGTSMLMRMLEAGGMPLIVDHQRQADSDNPNGYYEFERVKQLKSDANWIDSAVGSAVKVIYTLLYDLPQEQHYRCIFMRRDLDEIIASQDVMLKRLGKETAGLSAADLKRLFQAHLNKVETWLAGRDHIDVLSIWYSDVVQDPAVASRQIAEFLGGDLDVAEMAAAVDSKLYRQKARTLSKAQ